MIYPNLTAFPTYWENGMKVSAEHFQHLENSIEDTVRDGRALALTATGGFGLLPNSAFTIRNAQGSNPQAVRVILSACRAILPGGYRVEILPENIQQHQIPEKEPFVEFVPAPGIRYHVLLSVNTNRRVPCGVPQTRPVRKPHLCEEYHLEVIPQEKLPIAGHLAASRMKIAEWEGGKILEGYIPATTTIRGFPLLVKWHDFFKTQLENIVRIALQIVHQYRTSDVPRTAFCLPLIRFVRQTQGSFALDLPDQSPVKLLVYFGNLAGLVQSYLDAGDRDFVRNHLKNGQVHQLGQTLEGLREFQMPPYENMALAIAKIKNFCEAVLLTLRSLLETKNQEWRQGDRNMISG